MKKKKKGIKDRFENEIAGISQRFQDLDWKEDENFEKNWTTDTRSTYKDIGNKEMIHSAQTNSIEGNKNMDPENQGNH